MTGRINGHQVTQITTDYAWPTAVRERVQELSDLTGNQLEALLNPLVASTPSVFEPLSLTSPGLTARGDGLYFQPAASTPPRITRLKVEQEFEGAVVSVDLANKTFIARLADLTAPGPEEEAEIAFEEISPDDHVLILPGALFSWMIGLITEASGQVRRVSEIRFRRFFRFSADTMARAERQAETMFDLLNERDAA